MGMKGRKKKKFEFPLYLPDMEPNKIYGISCPKCWNILKIALASKRRKDSGKW